jgi:hypothetical protein
MTTYITDFFEQLFDEEYNRHIADKDDMYEFWSRFCRRGTENDVNPDWCSMKINDWIKETLEEQDGWGGIYQMLRTAIYQDADDHYLRKCIYDKHQEWFNDEDLRLNQEALDGSGESEESSEVEVTDPLPAARAVFSCKKCGVTIYDEGFFCICAPDDVNPPDPDGDGVAD